MAKGALYWRLKDEQTGKWTYKKAKIKDDVPGYFVTVQRYQGE